jgi:tetratricopeptide (TPR) repeat protein
MVPGAGLLKGGPIFSGFDIKNNLKSSGKLTFEQLSSILAVKHEPLKELAGETIRLQEESGLVSVREAKEIDYQKMQKRVLNWVEEYLKNKKDTLLCSEENGGQSNAIFLPFYALNGNKPKALSFELNINLFTDEDFYYLNKIHRHSIILEMTSDARRRKRIYEDWLLNDQEKHKNFGLTYEKMSTEKRTAKSIVITGLRNYLEATTGSPEKEICVSPQEMYEKNLPSMINEDKRWIKRMEQLIKDIEERDKEREKRIDSINLATLIDSFLRGWPSIFLDGEDAKQGYEKWCDNKREKVWKVIHKKLRRQGIRIEPLLVENTVFRVQNINNERLLVTPLHLIDSNEFLIFLSKKYGLTYYVNLWERRKLIFAERTPGESNQKKSNYFFNAGVHALNNNNRSKALEFFKQALQFHPVYAFSEIFKGWWQQFSRDTSEDFNNHKDLLRGITAFTKDSYQESIEYLKSFVKRYPDYLADPYLMISFQENQIRSGFSQKIEKHQELINEYEKVRESYKIRYEALESNRKLFELIKKFNIEKLGFI